MSHSYEMKKVLIIDDDSFQRNMLSIVCSEAKFHTSLVSNGLEALAALKETSFDLIISDLEMPKMDGLQLLRKLAEMRVTTPIILVSGHAESILVAAKEMAREGGLIIASIIQKPYVPEEVLRLLKNIKRVNPPDQPSNRSQKKIQALLPAEIEQGLLDGAIMPYYQPQVCLEKRRLVGFECLARWKIPAGGVLGPAAFIPVAENNGLMPLLTNAVLKAAFKDIFYWNKKGRELPISINISTDNLKDITFPDQLLAIAQEHRVKPSSVILEITETKVIEEVRQCLEVMSRIRMQGFGLSIDDFGTGYASLKQLQYCPFTELKLDRSYVAAAVEEKTSRSVLETGIQLAKSLSLSCIAEGVETPEQSELLMSLGCSQHQGFLYAKPMPGEKVLPWVQTLFRKEENERKAYDIFAITSPEERTPFPSEGAFPLEDKPLTQLH